MMRHDTNTSTSATAEATPADDTAGLADSAVADFSDLKQRLKELGDYFRHYWAVKRERLRRKSQRSLVFVGGIVLASVVMLAFLATAGVLLCVGIAVALNVATGSIWMGPLLTGVTVLLLLAGGTVWAKCRVDTMAMKRFSDRCQTRRAELRVRYGRGIDE